jgi:hypothetical protein
LLTRSQVLLDPNDNDNNIFHFSCSKVSDEITYFTPLFIFLDTNIETIIMTLLMFPLLGHRHFPYKKEKRIRLNLIEIFGLLFVDRHKNVD